MGESELDDFELDDFELDEFELDGSRLDFDFGSNLGGGFGGVTPLAFLTSPANPSPADLSVFKYVPDEYMISWQ